MGKRLQNCLQTKKRPKENSILREKMGDEIKRIEIALTFPQIYNKAGFINTSHEYKC
jgi:hypothetical protein